MNLCIERGSIISMERCLRPLEASPEYSQIVHVCAHGAVIDSRDALILEDANCEGEVLGGTELDRLLQTQVTGEGSRRPDLVFLSACHSEGVGSVLASHRVPAVVCVSSSVTDATACTFTTAFYTHLLGDARPVREAFARALELTATTHHLPTDTDGFQLLCRDTSTAICRAMGPGGVQAVFHPDSPRPPAAVLEGHSVGGVVRGMLEGAVHNIPHTTQGLIGRHFPIQAVIRGILAGRVVWLTGERGAGRTAVGHEAANRLLVRGRYSAGAVVCIDLARLVALQSSPPTGGSLVAAMRVALQQVAPSADPMDAHASDPLLVILDGLDTALSGASDQTWAATAHVIGELQHACSSSAYRDLVVCVSESLYTTLRRDRPLAFRGSQHCLITLRALEPLASAEMLALYTPRQLRFRDILAGVAPRDLFLQGLLALTYHASASVQAPGVLVGTPPDFDWSGPFDLPGIISSLERLLPRDCALWRVTARDSVAHEIQRVFHSLSPVIDVSLEPRPDGHACVIVSLCVLGVVSCHPVLAATCGSPSAIVGLSHSLSTRNLSAIAPRDVLPDCRDQDWIPLDKPATLSSGCSPPHPLTWHEDEYQQCVNLLESDCRVVAISGSRGSGSRCFLKSIHQHCLASPCLITPDKMQREDTSLVDILDSALSTLHLHGSLPGVSSLSDIGHFQKEGPFADVLLAHRFLATLTRSLVCVGHKLVLFVDCCTPQLAPGLQTLIRALHTWPTAPLAVVTRAIATVAASQCPLTAQCPPPDHTTVVQLSETVCLDRAVDMVANSLGTAVVATSVLKRVAHVCGRMPFILAHLPHLLEQHPDFSLTELASVDLCSNRSLALLSHELQRSLLMCERHIPLLAVLAVHPASVEEVHEIMEELGMSGVPQMLQQAEANRSLLFSESTYHIAPVISVFVSIKLMATAEGLSLRTRVHRLLASRVTQRTASHAHQLLTVCVPGYRPVAFTPQLEEAWHRVKMMAEDQLFAALGILALAPPSHALHVVAREFRSVLSLTTRCSDRYTLTAAVQVSGPSIAAQLLCLAQAMVRMGDLLLALWLCELTVDVVLGSAAPELFVSGHEWVQQRDRMPRFIRALANTQRNSAKLLVRELCLAITRLLAWTGYLDEAQERAVFLEELLANKRPRALTRLVHAEVLAILAKIACYRGNNSSAVDRIAKSSDITMALIQPNRPAKKANTFSTMHMAGALYCKGPASTASMLHMRSGSSKRRGSRTTGVELLESRADPLALAVRQRALEICCDLHLISSEFLGNASAGNLIPPKELLSHSRCPDSRASLGSLCFLCAGVESLEGRALLEALSQLRNAWRLDPSTAQLSKRVHLAIALWGASCVVEGDTLHAEAIAHLNASNALCESQLGLCERNLTVRAYASLVSLLLQSEPGLWSHVTKLLEHCEGDCDGWRRWLLRKVLLVRSLLGSDVAMHSLCSRLIQLCDILTSLDIVEVGPNVPQVQIPTLLSQVRQSVRSNARRFVAAVTTNNC